MSEQTIITSSIEVKDVAQTEEKRLEAMRAAFEKAIARRPMAMIIMSDFTGGDTDAGVAGTAAVGSEGDIRVLHREGTRALAAMISQAREAVEEPRPPLNG